MSPARNAPTLLDYVPFDPDTKMSEAQVAACPAHTQWRVINRA